MKTLKDYEYFRTDLGVLYCGDCLEILPLITEPIDFVLTDPPYNINLKPLRKLTESIENDNMSEKDFELFLKKYFDNINKILTHNSFLFTFLGWSTIPIFRKVLDGMYELKSMPIWYKNNFGIGYYTRPQYEPILLYFKGKPEPIEKPISDVIMCEKIIKPEHSCEKPSKLAEIILNHFSVDDDVVFDGFFGLGFVGVACEKLNRRWIGIEISEKYCEIAKKRILQESQQLKMFREEGL